jgi:hypothetical protein
VYIYFDLRLKKRRFQKEFIGISLYSESLGHSEFSYASFSMVKQLHSAAWNQSHVEKIFFTKYDLLLFILAEPSMA